MKARDLPKLHHEDPTGFWKLVRTGKELPEIGQQILFVYDLRGTEAELRHQMFTRIANGDPYRITNEAPNNLPAAVAGLNAELFKLPTKPAAPKTVVGVVEDLGFDEVLQEHYITIASRGNVWSAYYASEHIIYWAPLPTPADTFTPREGDLADLYYTDHLIQKERQVLDELEAKHAQARYDAQALSDKA